MIQSTAVGGRSWRFPMARGIVMVMYGSAFIGTSDPSVERIALAFGCYAFVDGALAVAGMLRRTSCGVPPWCLLVRGIAGMAAGIATLLGRLDSPAQIHLVLVTWALAAGLFELVVGLCARQRLDGDTYQMLSGLTTMGLGVTLMLLPPAAVSVVWPLLSIFAVIAGTMLVLTGLRTDVLRGAAARPF